MTNDKKKAMFEKASEGADFKKMVRNQLEALKHDVEEFKKRQSSQKDNPLPTRRHSKDGRKSNTKRKRENQSNFNRSKKLKKENDKKIDEGGKKTKKTNN